MEAALIAVTSSLEEAKVMLATAKSQLRANNVADISTLNGRVDALQESTLELLHLHNQLLARKREVQQMMEELAGFNALAVAGAVSSLPSLNDLP